MQSFEETALETFPYEISLWKRYVDDTIVILMDAPLDAFTAHINVIHPAIRFTREEEEDGRLAVLDAQISRREDRLTFLVYREPTHTDQYLAPVLQQAAATAQAGGHILDVGPSVCHHLQGQGLPDPGDTTFEESAKCLRIHQEGLEGGNWIPPKDMLFRPSIIWIPQ